MKVAYVGVGHWHIRHYTEPILSQPDVQLVGVSDPSLETARALGEKLGCKAFSDYREMCRAVKPDFVIALGRHCDMAAQGVFLVDEGIPFAMEKPCGITYAEVRDLAERAARKGVFAAATFGFGYTEMFERIEQVAGNERLDYMSVRAIGGSPMRYGHLYRPAVAWVLDPAQAGGGPFINLAIHYLQLFRRLTRGAHVSVRSAVTSNRGYGLPVEDYVAVQLEAAGALCQIETGYSYPGPGGSDESYSIRTERHYFVVPDLKTVRVTDVAAVEAVIRRGNADELAALNASPNMGGALQTFQASSNRFPLRWAVDVVARVRAGQPPVETIADMADCMRLVEEAYRLAGPPPIPAASGSRFRIP